MANDRSALPDLSQAQRAIMEIIWERGESSAQEIREVLAPRRDLAKNTVRTMLERMEEKGWLTHREVGRTYLYQAAQPRQASIGQKVWEVVEDLCGGSPEELMSALLDYRGLTAQELKRIRAMLDAAKSNRPSTGAGT